MAKLIGVWVGASACAAALLGSSAQAATFEVTRTGDPKPGKCKPADCSLREAVIAANKRNGADTILLPGKGDYELTRGNLGEDGSKEGDLDVKDKLAIKHPGKGRAAIDGNGNDRVLDVKQGAPTKLSRLKIHHGRLPAAIKNSSGGGIETASDLRVARSVISRNRADFDGGIDAGYDSRLSLVRSVVKRNVAATGTGGVTVNGTDGAMRIIRSRITANRAPVNGGLSMDGGSLLMKRSSLTGNDGTVNTGGGALSQVEGTISDSTIAGNKTASEGGGLSVTFFADITIRGTTFSGNTGGNGGGLYVQQGPTVLIVNSTFANNHAVGEGGGIATGFGDEEVALISSTVAFNTAGFGTGGLHAEATMGVANTIAAHNLGPASAPDDCDGAFDADGGNLLTNLTDCTGFDIGTTDELTTDARLAGLAPNGGPTRTVALRAGSPAIGLAIPSSSPARDQRGENRDGDPDSGAYER